MATDRTRCLPSIASMLAAALIAPAGILAPLPALAQPGSRLCGWTSEVPSQGTATGLLLELRNGDDSYAKDCRVFIEDTKNKIAADAALSPMKWIKVDKSSCDWVGKMFQSTSQPSTDMCDPMSANVPYKVQKSTGSDKKSVTTYVRI